MANLRNEFEFRSALLTALGQEHTEAEAKNEEMWRRKMLDGLGVEYNQNDVNQFGLFREKLIEGVTSKSEGGGGSSDLVAVGIYNTYNTTVTLKYYEQQGATPVDYAIEGKTGIALSVPKNSGFVSMVTQYKIGSKTADAFVIETEPFSSAMVVNAGVLVLETSMS